jgi:dephospho-CoA kinase
MPDQPRTPVIAVGLTGGIASGKTAASDHFARLGVPVIDTDVIAREVVEPGQPVLQEVIAAFGDDIVDDEGRLRRRKLRDLIFSDPEKQALLESIVHPAIRAETRRRVADAKGPYCLIVIPLLAESGHFDWLDRVLVVDVPEEIQIKRLTERDGVTELDARKSLAAQAGRDVRLQLADDILDNSGNIDDLGMLVEDLHRKYLDIASESALPER